MIERLASASVNHRYRTIVVWLAALIGVVVLGGMITSSADINDRLDGSDSQRAYDLAAQLLARRRRGPFDDLTPREREVLGLMAEGRSNVGIARHLVVSDGAVEKHISSIFSKLGLATSDTEHRRVLAVLQYLQHG